MDLQLLSRIGDELESSEVAALCFLCREVISQRKLEGVSTAYTVTVKHAQEASITKDYKN